MRQYQIRQRGRYENKTDGAGYASRLSGHCFFGLQTALEVFVASSEGG